MPRTCNLEGCGIRLTTKTGAPDYRRHWCSHEHKNIDRKEAQAARRKVVHGRKCRLCGRKAVKDDVTIGGVSRDTGPELAEALKHEEFLTEHVRLRSERTEESEVPQVV